MRIDITSFFFNTSIKDGTATPAWGISIGQSKVNNYKINTEIEGLNNFIIGMNYKAHSDFGNLDISKMSSKREPLFFSIFDKIFINNIEVENYSFILLFVKEHSDTHDGRLIISYPNYAIYENKTTNKKVNNNETIEKFSQILNCQNGSWFVYDLSIRNQDELHFSAVVVDNNKSLEYENSKKRKEEWTELISIKENTIHRSSKSDIQNRIYYGAPGTGKSYKVDNEIKDLDSKFYERITFHPEFDHASFVGGYKPISKEVERTYEDGKYLEHEVHYEFIPQAFTNIYVRAWNDLDNQYYLAIEEINRGNCAEIFGDIFQLLDRNSNYTVSPSDELKEYLNKVLTNKDGINNGLKLPPNLSILATMNTSDQSLFPMDSAFKRRWDWEYIPICYEDIPENESYKYNVIIDETHSFKWIDFIKNVNTVIKTNPNLGMDKCIGNYFIKSDSKEITLKEFVNKAIFYLWNDVFKDEDSSDSIFEKGTSYEDFFPIEKNGKVEILKVLKAINIEPTIVK